MFFLNAGKQAKMVQKRRWNSFRALQQHRVKSASTRRQTFAKHLFFYVILKKGEKMFATKHDKGL